MRLCPNCNDVLVKNKHELIGVVQKLYAEWYCEQCHKSGLDEYTFYNKETLIFK